MSHQKLELTGAEAQDAPATQTY